MRGIAATDRRDTRGPLSPSRAMSSCLQGVRGWSCVVMVTVILLLLSVTGTFGANVPLPEGKHIPLPLTSFSEFLPRADCFPPKSVPFLFRRPCMKTAVRLGKFWSTTDQSLTPKKKKMWGRLTDTTHNNTMTVPPKTLETEYHL
ncbi:hypothetical protein BaRGS_00013006 [Batillaria attramentaria]|uniref:Uncharacterized protein n=1 Tax=Batillaria attramentaria TaxID=370345 RepID=A0ABD0L932_9CAEN